MGNNTVVGSASKNRVYTKEEHERAFAKIKLAVKNFLISNPFFGVLCLRQEIVEASSWCPTMAVDGRHLFFNTGFVLRMNPFEVQFVISHEILHLAYGHLDRVEYADGEERNRKVFNIACDYIVNRDTLNAKIGQMPESVYYDKKYEDNIAEEVYEKIKNDNLTAPTLDYHIDLSGNGVGGGPGITTDENGNKHSSQEPSYDTTESKGNIEKFKEDLIVSKASARSDDISAGRIPGNLLRIIQELTEPKINWRNYIRKVIKSLFKNDTNWNKLSRRSFDSAFVFPDKNNPDKVKIHISIDTSGSMTSEMLRDFLSEVRGVITQYTDYELMLWTFDTQVYNPVKYTPQNAHKLPEYEMMGGGGTTFMTNWHYMKEENIKPDLFIMFTDGYPCDTFGPEEKYCDTLYIIYDNKNGQVDIPKKYGRSVNYDDY